MTTKLFLQNYKDIIAIPSISAFDEILDQSNLTLINYLAEQFSHFGFEISIHPVPDSRNKFNLLAKSRLNKQFFCLEDLIFAR